MGEMQKCKKDLDREKAIAAKKAEVAAKQAAKTKAVSVNQKQAVNAMMAEMASKGKVGPKIIDKDDSDSSGEDSSGEQKSTVHDKMKKARDAGEGVGRARGVSRTRKASLTDTKLLRSLSRKGSLMASVNAVSESEDAPQRFVTCQNPM